MSNLVQVAWTCLVFIGPVYLYVYGGTGSPSDLERAAKRFTVVICILLFFTIIPHLFSIIFKGVF